MTLGVACMLPLELRSLPRQPSARNRNWLNLPWRNSFSLLDPRQSQLPIWDRGYEEPIIQELKTNLDFFLDINLFTIIICAHLKYSLNILHTERVAELFPSLDLHQGVPLLQSSKRKAILTAKKRKGVAAR